MAEKTEARADSLVKPVADWPGWTKNFRDQYLAGSSSFFILHGNVDDLIGSSEGEDQPVMSLPDFLAERLFKDYDLVLHYDPGRGLRPHAGRDPRRLTQMNAFLDRVLGQVMDLPKDSTLVLRVLERLVTLLLVAGSEAPVRKTAFLFDYGEWVCPPGDRMTENLATCLNWARSPVIRRVNMIFIMMTQSLAGLHPALVQSSYTSEIRVPLPTQEERQAFIRRRYPEQVGESFRLARLSAGLTLSNLDNLMRLGSRKSPLDVSEPAGVIKTPIGPSTPSSTLSDNADLMAEAKKQLIESQCPGLLEFIEPRLDLSLVAGHTTVKQRLADDARLIRQGRLEAAPMGYLICGPVGVGKTFLALCYAGTVGIPCVTLRNFRSKYVGETEANLERILSILRELGPVAVIIDEADAAVGDRGATGDSGTSARVFAQLASQMGDTRYRGQIIWFLLTCRPDLLPVDLKRQGRCEEHLPLFYPETPEELHEMFLAMSKKLKIGLDPASLPDLAAMKPLSGADIESVLTRAWREALLKDGAIDRELLTSVLATFRSSRGPEHELQWLAAILESTDLRYLPPSVRQVVEKEEATGRLEERFRELKSRLE